MKHRKTAKLRQAQGLERMMNATERLGLYEMELQELCNERWTHCADATGVPRVERRRPLTVPALPRSRK